MSNNLEILVGRIDGKLDSLIEGQKERDGRYKDHDERIGKLERGHARIIGWAAGAATCASAAASVLVKQLFPGN